jgi:hypothetical protein
MAMRTLWGDYTIPAGRIGKVLDHLITVVKNHPSSFTKADFVREIGAAPKSNGPADKLRDMISYGLIEDKVQMYVITELGKSAISKDPNERPKSIERIVRNIPLWNLLINASGFKQPFDVFSKNAHKIIANDPTLDNSLHQLYNAYIEDITCISKTPPYTKVSKNLGKQRTRKPQEKQVFEPESINTQLQNETKLIAGVIRTSNEGGKGECGMPGLNVDNLAFKGGEILVKKLFFEVDGHRIEIKDDASYLLALVFLQAKRKRFGTDYE